MKNRTKKLLALLLTLATCLATFAPMMAFADTVAEPTVEGDLLWKVDFEGDQWKDPSLLGHKGTAQHNGFRLMNAWDYSGDDTITSKSYVKDGVLNARWNGVSYSGNSYIRAFIDTYFPEDSVYMTRMFSRYGIDRTLNSRGYCLKEDFTFTMSIRPVGVIGQSEIMFARGDYDIKDSEGKQLGTNIDSSLVRCEVRNGESHIFLHRPLNEAEGETALPTAVLPTYEFSTVEVLFHYDEVNNVYTGVSLYVNGLKIDSATLAKPYYNSKEDTNIGGANFIQLQQISFFRMFDGYNVWINENNGIQIDYMQMVGFYNKATEPVSQFSPSQVDPKRGEETLYAVDFEDWTEGYGEAGRHNQNIHSGFRLMNVLDKSETDSVSTKSYVRNGIVTAQTHGVAYDAELHAGTHPSAFEHGFVDLMMAENKLQNKRIRGGDVSLTIEIRPIKNLSVSRILAFEGEDDDGHTNVSVKESHTVGQIIWGGQEQRSFLSMDGEIDASDKELSPYHFSTIEFVLRYSYAERSYTKCEVYLNGEYFGEQALEFCYTETTETDEDDTEIVLEDENNEESGDGNQSGNTTNTEKVDTNMSSIRYFRMFHGWNVWTGRPDAALQIDSVRVTTVPSNKVNDDHANNHFVPRAEVTEFIGYQTTTPDANGNYDVRLLATMGNKYATAAPVLANYKNVGFKVQITARDTVLVDGKKQLADKIVQMSEQFGVCNTVYSSVVAADGRSEVKTYTANELGGQYIFALNCLDMSTSWAPGNVEGENGYDVLTFTVTTYYTLMDGTQVEERTYSFEVYLSATAANAGNGNWTVRQDPTTQTGA